LADRFKAFRYHLEIITFDGSFAVLQLD